MAKSFQINLITFGLTKFMLMKKSTPELRIKELEFELSTLKSADAAAKNSAKGIASVSYDITERKQAVAILQKNDEHYKIMFESSPIAINITHGSNIIYANPSYLKIFGFSTLDDLKNIAPLDLFTPEWRPKIQENIQKRAKGFSVPDSYEAECFRKDGSIFPILMYLTRTMFSDGMATIAFTIDVTERKILEKKLQESEKRYRTIFETAIEGMLSMDKEHRIIFVNKRISDMLGYLPEDLIGRKGEDFMLEEDIKVYYKRLEQRRGGFGENYECRLCRRDGSIIWTQVSATVVKDSHGNFDGSFGMFTDITERRQLEDLRRKSEEKFSKTFRISPEAISINRLSDGRYIDANDACLRKTGFTKEEMIGKTSIELNLWADPEDRIKYIHTLEKDGKVRNFEMRLRMKSSEIRHFLASTEIIELEDEKYILGHFFDITELKRAEQELIKAKEKAEENEHKFRSYIENAPDGIILMQNDGKYLDVNSELCKMFGYTKEEFLNINYPIIAEEEFEKAKKSNVKILTEGKYVDEFRFVTKNGIFFYGLMSAVKISDNNTLAFIKNIDNIKKTQLELIIAKEKAEESERLKSAFLTNMSHEIRTPMNGILGFTELLKEPHLTVEEQQDFIQTIQVSGARMLNTINSIVDIAKIESGLIDIDIKETNINEKVEFIYKFFRPEVEKKGLQFLVKRGLPTKEAIIKTDIEKVYSILTNLVKNAIKFTYDGSIEFGYDLKSESETGSAGQSRSAELEFYVKDTGIGIPENQKELIFERFRQGSESNNRGYEGSGLGLSISKSYVEMLGGRIWVESEEGRNSTFYFTIPYNPVSEEITTLKDFVSDAHKYIQIKKLKILVVEDDEISYSLLSRRIQNISKEVLHAITGVEAVEACRNNPDIDLVLLDIRMPGMNGLEATQEIRQFNKDVIIIAQTAFGLSSDRERAIEAGCNDYIAKPINMTLLFELIKKHFNL